MDLSLVIQFVLAVLAVGAWRRIDTRFRTGRRRGGDGTA
jgi:hypothetical protein